MIQEYTLDTTLAYMTHIRNNAELSVRNLLREVAARQSSPEAVLHRIEYMDDGTPIGEQWSGLGFYAVADPIALQSSPSPSTASRDKPSSTSPAPVQKCGVRSTRPSRSATRQ